MRTLRMSFTSSPLRWDGEDGGPGQGCGDAGEGDGSSPPLQMEKGTEISPCWGRNRSGVDGPGQGRTWVSHLGCWGSGRGAASAKLTALWCRRNGKTSSGIGWRTCGPSRARHCTTSTSWRDSPSVSMAQHGTARHTMAHHGTVWHSSPCPPTSLHPCCATAAHPAVPRGFLSLLVSPFLQHTGMNTGTAGAQCCHQG